MKTTQEFEQFVANNLQSTIAELESKRQVGLDGRAKAAMPMQLIAFGVVGIVLLFVVLPRFFNSGVPKAFMLIILAMIGFGAYSAYKNKDKLTNMTMNSMVGNQLSNGAITDLKEKVIRPMISFVDPSFTYQPDKAVSLELINEVKLLHGDGYNSKGNDLVTGSINDIKFELSDIEVRKTAWSNIDQRTVDQEIIKGSVFVANFELEFTKPVYLIANKPTTKNEMHYAFNLEDERVAIELESVDFNKQFMLFSEDQVEARYIFTPTMMEHVKKLSDILGSNLYFAFYGNKMIIVNNNGRDNFEMDWAQSIETTKTLNNYYQQLIEQVNIINDLKLNTKIWKS